MRLRFSFAHVRTAIDVLRNRMPGALAMLHADSVGISKQTRGGKHSCSVTFFFGDDEKACGNAYRAIEHLYEMDRQQDFPTYAKEPRP